MRKNKDEGGPTEGLLLLSVWLASEDKLADLKDVGFECRRGNSGRTGKICNQSDKPVARQTNIDKPVYSLHLDHPHVLLLRLRPAFDKAGPGTLPANIAALGLQHLGVWQTSVATFGEGV